MNSSSPRNCGKTGAKPRSSNQGCALRLWRSQGGRTVLRPDGRGNTHDIFQVKHVKKHNLGIANKVSLPTKEWIHIPPNGKFGKSSTQKCPFWGGYVIVPWRVPCFFLLEPKLSKTKSGSKKIKLIKLMKHLENPWDVFLSDKKNILFGGSKKKSKDLQDPPKKPELSRISW